MVLVPVCSSDIDPVIGEFRAWAEPLAAKAEAKRIKRAGRKQARRMARKLGIDREIADQQFAIGYSEGVTSEELEQAQIIEQSRKDVESTERQMAERLKLIDGPAPWLC